MNKQIWGRKKLTYVDGIRKTCRNGIIKPPPVKNRGRPAYLTGIQNNALGLAVLERVLNLIDLDKLLKIIPFGKSYIICLASRVNLIKGILANSIDDRIALGCILEYVYVGKKWNEPVSGNFCTEYLACTKNITLQLYAMIIPVAEFNHTVKLNILVNQNILCRYGYRIKVKVSYFPTRLKFLSSTEPIL